MEKKSKITHYVINLTLDNVSDDPCEFKVYYGDDNGIIQTNPVFLKSASFNTGETKLSFTIDSPVMIYFLFVLLDENKEIAVDTGTTSQLWGNSFNHTMKTETENISFLVKNK